MSRAKRLEYLPPFCSNPCSSLEAMLENFGQHFDSSSAPAVWFFICPGRWNGLAWAHISYSKASNAFARVTSWLRLWSAIRSFASSHKPANWEVCTAGCELLLTKQMAKKTDRRSMKWHGKKSPKCNERSRVEDRILQSVLPHKYESCRRALKLYLEFCSAVTRQVNLIPTRAILKNVKDDWLGTNFLSRQTANILASISSSK